MSGTHHLHFMLQKEIVLCERMWRKSKGRKGEDQGGLGGDHVWKDPVAPQDEAGLTKTFQTWPRGWFHIP